MVGASTTPDGDSAVGGDCAEDDLSTIGDDDWGAVGAVAVGAAGNDGAAVNVCAAGGGDVIVCAAGGASTGPDESSIILGGDCAEGDLFIISDDWTATGGCTAAPDGG